jgi:hypothetical protein
MKALISFLVLVIVPITGFAQDRCTISELSALPASDAARYQELMPNIEKVGFCPSIGADTDFIEGYSRINEARGELCYFEYSNLSSLGAYFDDESSGTIDLRIMKAGDEGNCDGISHNSPGIYLTSDYSSSEELIGLYREELEKIIDCLSDQECLIEFIDTVNLWDRFFNSGYREFRSLVKNGDNKFEVEGVTIWRDSEATMEVDFSDVTESFSYWSLEIKRADNFRNVKLLRASHIEF